MMKTEATTITQTKVFGISETLATIIFSVVVFALPFTLGHPQLLVGSLVNAILILAAVKLKNKFLAPVILLPSIAVWLKGMIFGGYTIFLIYMMPLIWIGNSLLVFSIKRTINNLNIKNKTIKFLIGSGIGIILKVGFLFLVANILVNYKILPQLFITTMGALQLYTALIGTGIVLTVLFAEKKFNSNTNSA